MLTFVPFDETYLHLSLRWLNDPEIQQLIDSHVNITAELQKEWYERIKNDSTYKIWGMSYDGVPIGACGIKKIDFDAHTGEYWCYIGEKKYWGGKGRLIIEQICNKAINLRIKKLVIVVHKDNQRSISLHQKEGFIIESCNQDKIVLSKSL